MSHFCVLVLSEEGQDIEDLLVPYMENCCGMPPEEYMEFYEDDRCEVDPETGRRGYWQNPNAKWDWWEVGGRFKGLLKASRGERLCGEGYQPGGYDRARLGDCDFSPDPERAREAGEFWDGYVEGRADGKGRPFSWMSPDCYRKRYGDKETFVRARSTFVPWAVVTPDGAWHEEGKMWYWGISGESDEDAVAWETGFYEKHVEGLDPDVTATIVDCHI